MRSARLIIAIFCAVLAQPPLPTLPDEFTAGIEANILDKNYTARRWEYYDYANNRFRMDVYTENATYVEILDANKDIRYEIKDWTECKLFTFNDTRIVDPSSHHLRNITDLFEFGAQFEEVYTGIKSVRGVPCDSWRHEISHGSADGYSNYTLDWFFSEESWKIQDGHRAEYRIPLRAEINGTHYGNNGESRSFHHVYDFFFFSIGAPNAWYFEITDYLRCGAEQHRDLPELPNDFETTIEFTHVNENYTATIHEYIDFDNNHTRFEFHRRHSSFVEILNFDTKIHVEVIDHWNCTIHAFPNNSRVRSQPSASRLFRFGPEYEEKYRGQRVVRGIPCDVWDSDVSESRGNTTRNFTLTYYFSVPEWEVRGAHSHRIPVRAEERGMEYHVGRSPRPIHNIYEFVNFIVGKPRNSVFHPSRSLLCASTIFKDLPDLPSQFSTGIEMTLTESNYTAVLREIYDYDNDRMRIDYTTPQGSFTSIYFVDTRKHYKITNRKNCTVEDALELSHLPTSSDLFQFGSQYEEHYQGVYTVRGIPCDVWLRNITSNVTTGGVRALTEYSALYAFSVQEWNMRAHHLGSRTHRIPVQIEVIGTTKLPNATHNFHQFYDYVDFSTEDPEESSFQPQASWNCPGWMPPPACSPTVITEEGEGKTRMNGGVGFGLWLLGAVMGGLIASLATFFILKKRMARAPSGGAMPGSVSQTHGHVQLE